MEVSFECGHRPLPTLPGQASVAKRIALSTPTPSIPETPLPILCLREVVAQAPPCCRISGFKKG